MGVICIYLSIYLSYLFLSFPILSNLILSNSIYSDPIVSNLILLYPAHSSAILSHPILSNPVLFILFILFYFSMCVIIKWISVHSSDTTPGRCGRQRRGRGRPHRAPPGTAPRLRRRGGAAAALRGAGGGRVNPVSPVSHRARKQQPDSCAIGCAATARMK